MLKLFWNHNLPFKSGLSPCSRAVPMSTKPLLQWLNQWICHKFEQWYGIRVLTNLAESSSKDAWNPMVKASQNWFDHAQSFGEFIGPAPGLGEMDAGAGVLSNLQRELFELQPWAQVQIRAAQGHSKPCVEPQKGAMAVIIWQLLQRKS